MAKKVYLKGEEFVFSRVKGNKESTYRDGDINLTPANIGASAEGHTHDDRYYTESEVDTKLNGKANASHGNHVPTTQTADNATFLRNDNTWAKVTPANIGAQPAGSYASASHTHDDRYYTESEINTKLNSKANSSHTHGNGDITSLDAGKITSGTISIDRLPHGALERLTVVADDTARFKLTSSTIQKGDTVKVTSTGKMYYVVDETKLSTEAGYEVYAAGTAASVPWSGVTGKPSTYTPSSHTHTKSQITDFPSSLPANGGNSSTVNGHTVNADVPSGAKFTDTNTWRPLGTTADTACAGNDSRLSNARPASDVSTWAKASTKPTYTASEVGAVPISGGTVNGAITFGKNDAYGIRTNTDNYGRIGDATNQFYEVYANTIYENKIKLSEKYAGKSVATQSAQGLMSAEDKKKLDGIASGATANPGTVTQVNVGTSTYYPSSGIIHLPAYPTSLPATGDSKDCTVTFESGDSSTGSSTPPAVITSGEKHSSLFNKFSTAVKNVRWLLSKMGTTDISAIGNGTVTGALSTLNSNMIGLKKTQLLSRTLSPLASGEISLDDDLSNYLYYEIIYSPDFQSDTRRSSGLIPVTSPTEVISVTPNAAGKGVLIFTRSYTPNGNKISVGVGYYYAALNSIGQNYSGCNVVTRVYGYK